MNQLEKVKAYIEPLIKKENLILYDVRFTTFEGMRTLQVSICDENYNMDMDTCEKISDQLSSALDREDLIEGNYVLDVCSPGAERELVNESQLNEAIDSYVHVELKNPKAGFDMIEGYLKSINENEITIEYKEKTKKKELIIERENIKIIRLAVEL